MFGQPVAQHAERAAIGGVEAGDRLIGAEKLVLLQLAHMEDGSTLLTTTDERARDRNLHRDVTVDIVTLVTVLMAAVMRFSALHLKREITNQRRKGKISRSILGLITSYKYRNV